CFELDRINMSQNNNYSRREFVRCGFLTVTGMTLGSAFAAVPGGRGETASEKFPLQISGDDLDFTLEPAPINTNPGPEYSDEARDYAMVIGLDRTPGGRLWAVWV